MRGLGFRTQQTLSPAAGESAYGDATDKIFCGRVLLCPGSSDINLFRRCQRIRQVSSGGCYRNDVGTASKVIQLFAPPIHHLDAFFPKLCARIGPVVEVEQMFLTTDQAFVSSVSRATRSCTSSKPLMRYSNSPRFSGSCLVTM